MSKADEIRARERYMDDPLFHNTVCVIRQLLTETRLSPNELHDAVNLAADQVNQDLTRCITELFRISE